MHIISKRAAVAIDSEISAVSDAPSFSGKHTCEPMVRTLWASEPFNLQTGRVVAVRLMGGRTEAGFIEKRASTLRWLPTSAVMSAAQERQWLRDAKFVAR